jgi:hypothetical protein
VTQFLLCFKHPAFQEEREWRLVHIGGGHPRYDRSATTPKIRTFDGNLIPYREVSFRPAVEASTDDTAGIRFPIVDVKIGPTMNAELNRESILRLFARNGARSGAPGQRLRDSAEVALKSELISPSCVSRG